MHVQTFVTEPTVEGFDRRVVGRISAATEVENDLVRVGPEIHGRTDELGAIVAIGAGVYGIYEAFTATRFENTGGGLGPAKESWYSPATLPMRILVGIFAAAILIAGIISLLRATH